MSAARVRIAQVGVGGMGLAHVRALQASDRAELVGLCDLSTAALKVACGDAAVPCFSDPESLFREAQPEAVILVLPHDLYPPVVAMAAERGIAILKEKPFARNLTDAMALHNAVTTAGVPFLCAAQRQYAKPFRAARELLDAGTLGDVFMTQGTITYPWHLHSARWAWRGQRERSGGIAVVDSGWHILDALVWLKGLPSSVYCRVGGLRAAAGAYDVDDKAILVFDFPDGSIGSVTACYVTVPSRFELNLHGTKGTLELSGQQLVHHPLPAGEPEVVVDDGTDVIAAQLAHFLDVVQHGVTPRVGIEEALHLQRVVEAAYESAATDRPVELLW